MPKTPTKPPRPVERRGYNVAEWCEAFGRSRDTCYALMRSGRLRYVDLGGRRFIPVEAAEALLSNSPTETEPQALPPPGSTKAVAP